MSGVVIMYEIIIYMKLLIFTSSLIFIKQIRDIKIAETLHKHWMAPGVMWEATCLADS